jgi:hypothetical protein
VDSDTNLLLIHDLQDAYIDDKVSGQKRAGFSGVEGIARHAAMFAGGRDGKPFSATVTRCTPAWHTVGTVYEGDEINFPTYAANAVPQLDPSVWL